MAIADDLPNYPFPKPSPLEPPPEWAQLRTCPVTMVTAPSGDQVGVVGRYEDVRSVMADPRFSRNLHQPGAARLATTEDGGIFSRPSQAPSDISEGEGHKRWRRLLSGSFTVRRMREKWRPRVQQLTDALIDRMLVNGAPADIVADLGFPLPVQVICALVGAPAEDSEKFAHWSQVMLTLTRYTQEEVNSAVAEFQGYATKLVEAKRANPDDDLLSELTQVHDSADGRLSHGELVATVVGLLLAGHETTSNMIGKMTAMLLAHRERFQAVVDNPELVPGTVDEVLRMDVNGGIGLPRYLTEDIELDGTVVPAGTTVLVNQQAANRDETRFTKPNTFDPTRPNNQHLTFGAGPHFCVGQPLARTELQVVLATLARRLPTLALRDDPAQLPMRKGVMVGGLDEVWVTWDQP